VGQHRPSVHPDDNPRDRCRHLEPRDDATVLGLEETVLGKRVAASTKLPSTQNSKTVISLAQVVAGAQASLKVPACGLQFGFERVQRQEGNCRGDKILAEELAKTVDKLASTLSTSASHITFLISGFMTDVIVTAMLMSPQPLSLQPWKP